METKNGYIRKEKDRIEEEINKLDMNNHKDRLLKIGLDCWVNALVWVLSLEGDE